MLNVKPETGTRIPSLVPLYASRCAGNFDRFSVCARSAFPVGSRSRAGDSLAGAEPRSSVAVLTGQVASVPSAREAFWRAGRSACSNAFDFGWTFLLPAFRPETARAGKAFPAARHSPGRLDAASGG